MRLTNIIGQISQLPSYPKAKEVQPVREATFVRPLIEPEQFKATLNNYLKYIDSYNDVVNKYNEPWQHRNKSVKAVDYDVFKEVQKWNAINSHLAIEDYNKSALKFNAKHGNYIRYKYRQTVKPASRIYFKAILHMYAVQLRQLNSIHTKTNKQHNSKLPQVKINSHHVTTQQRAGVLNLNVSTRTVRNHLDRLEEAGVLLDRHYKGTKAPLTFKINPKIIVAICDENRKSLGTDNQSIKTPNRKEFQHIKQSTRYINNNKRKESVNNSLSKDFASQSLNQLIYKSTSPQVEAKPVKKQKIAQKSSAKILNILDRPQVLAEKLANGHYNYYVPLKTAELRRLITDSNLTDDDYRELIIQDFIKSSARLWAKNQASIGSWYNALIHIYNRYGTTNFAGKAMKRNKMYDWLMEMRYRLSYAMNWFDKREWRQVWYPNIYFDPLRKLPTDVCFAYTEKVWSVKMKKQQEKATKRRNAVAAAKRRSEKLSVHRKGIKRLDSYIYRYLRKEIELEELTMALTTMPESVQDCFSERINTLTTRYLAQDE